MRALFLCFLLGVLAPSESSGQLFKRKINQYKDGKRHGVWIIYTDSAETQRESRGRYSYNHEVGTWKYYHENGRVRKKEVFHNLRIRTRYFYPSGKLKSKGLAFLEGDAEYLRYYYQGKWKYYDEDGKINSIIYYEKGELTRSIEPEKQKK